MLRQPTSPDSRLLMLYIFSYHTDKDYLLFKLTPRKIIPVQVGDKLSGHIAGLPQNAEVAFQINLSWWKHFFSDTDDPCRMLRNQGFTVLNDGIYDIRKTALYDQLADAGLPSLGVNKEETRGDELLFLKSDFNYGAQYERLLSEKEKEMLKLRVDFEKLPDHTKYYIKKASDVQEEEWKLPGLTVERYIDNAAHSFYRVFRYRDRHVLFSGHSKEAVKKMSRAENRHYNLYSKNDLPKEFTTLQRACAEQAEVYFDNLGVDFGAVDLVADMNGQPYIIDFNDTSHWSSDSLPEAEAYLRGYGYNSTETIYQSFETQGERLLHTGRQSFTSAYSADIVLLLDARDIPAVTASLEDNLTGVLATSRLLESRGINPDAAHEPYALLFKLLFSDPDHTPTVICRGAYRQGTEYTGYAQEVNYNIIVPHYGEPAVLRRCLNNLLSIAPGERIMAGIDGSLDDETEKWVLERKIRLFQTKKDQPAGPYVLRQKLIEKSGADIIVFQDSDDYSTLDRLDSLFYELMNEDCEVAGSGTVMLNEMERTVRSRFFPVLPSFSLRTHIGHCQLHPSTCGWREAWLEDFGFSSFIKFGLDTQQLLRSALYQYHTNTSDILYIKNHRKGALTTTPQTALGTKERDALQEEWKKDFTKVENDEIELEDSSLRRMDGEAYHDPLYESTLLLN